MSKCAPISFLTLKSSKLPDSPRINSNFGNLHDNKAMKEAYEDTSNDKEVSGKITE